MEVVKFLIHKWKENYLDGGLMKLIKKKILIPLSIIKQRARKNSNFKD